MTAKNDGGAAFPIYTPDMNVGDSAGPGMSLRDWFAGQALAGIMATNPPRGVGWQERAAWDAYSMARAMLAQRAKAED